jgi:mannose-1-phosphate guanylyltransferase
MMRLLRSCRPTTTFRTSERLRLLLECAFETAAQHPSAVVLLGASPRGPEVEYGWIELGPSIHGAGGVWSRVRGFFEKPSLHVARELLARGSLWNTFVMVGHVRGFLDMVNVSLGETVELLRSELSAKVRRARFSLTSCLAV